ncbi:hypothetical protein HFP57_16000 [Parasphingopyxis algicola]|uniref:cytosine permease n=1 Tax=Parasphingopyxis algicola TaxID=2026624 RepID=UPI0015A3698F|nr:cytosine permease [Parasphingopyxis algicola]QLC26383.1 hypothetical protein HFP57_16000 [Parasphingopyxis algicola]
MKEKLKLWWQLSDEQSSETADNPHAPLRPDQRRDTLPLLTLAFGWGFLVTGLIVGGALGNGMAFGDLLKVTAIGNTINFAIGAAVAYVGYRTGCNSGLLYRHVFGIQGAKVPALFIAFLTICWQGIVVGAFGFAWTQSFESNAFYAVAIFAGLLFTATTYFGVRGLEAVSLPAAVILILVGIYAGAINIAAAGGWEGFLALSERNAVTDPLTLPQAINLVVGSWIVGAIVMPEYSRFAKKAWVAIAIPFIVMIVAQWFLQILGALGGVVSGSYDFTTYMLAQGALIGTIGVIAMSFALWTTGDTNLYLPAVQTASVFHRPQKAMTVICGLLGTLLGLGIYERFVYWIDLLASLAPPVIGPLLVEFYIFGRRQTAKRETALPKWNWSAFAAYALGAGSTFIAPDWIAKSLVGLTVSIATYFLFRTIENATRPSLQSDQP